MGYELAFNFLLIAVGIFILIRSGVYIVHSLVKIAHFLNVSEFTLSFILMAFATTLPEFAIGVVSALKGEQILSLGNILGANILTLGLTLGLVTIIAGKLTMDGHSVAHRSWFNFFLGVSPVIFLIDGRLSRLDGLILISLFFLNLARLFHLREIFHHRRSFWLSFINHFERRPDGLNIGYFLKNILIFVAASGFLLFSAYAIIGGAKALSVRAEIPELLVGIFIIAIGTTLPELSFGIRSALSRHGDLSLGNLFGAATFNSTWILGIVALLNPIQISGNSVLWISAVTMVLILFLANLFLRSREYISRCEGLALVGIYVFFIVFQLIFKSF